jgi:serine/threonine protein kinase
MGKLAKPILFETAFDSYEVDEIIGEGGCGRVYGGRGVAVKVLAQERTSRDKRQRFKNETAFLARNKHRNIVTVIDHGLATSGPARGPFYVMPRFDGNLRDLMRTGPSEHPQQIIASFLQILDGVEAAHLQGAVNRDLKPENVLFRRAPELTLAIADFGTASFTEDMLITMVETSPHQRLANFQYAAPEQRMQGREVGIAADVFALGLMLNEMFTGQVAHGTEYRLIKDVAPEHGYLDGIVATMIRNTPSERPSSIETVKGLLSLHMRDALSHQRLSEISNTVVKQGEIDDPLALEPLRVVDFDWDSEILTLTLNRRVSDNWVNAFKRIGGIQGVWNKGPNTFSFRDDKALVSTRAEDVQRIIDYFKTWMVPAMQTLHQDLSLRLRQERDRKLAALRGEQQREEMKQKLRKEIRI